MALVAPVSPVGVTHIANNTVNVWLERVVRLANRAPHVGLQIVRFNMDGAGKNSYVRRVNERSRLTGVASIAVGSAAPEARATLTPSTITGDLFGLRTFIRDDAEAVSIEDELRVNVEQLLDAYDTFWHGQILDLFSSVTAVTGDNATVNDLENWDVVTALFRGDNHPPGQLWAVLHPDAVRDLRASLRTTAAALFSSSFGDEKARSLANASPGLGVPFDGYTLYESGDVPAGDTTGWTNCLGVLSEGMPVDSALALDIYKQATIEIQRDAGRFGQWQVVGGVAGCGIQSQGSCRAFITRT